MTTKVVTLQIKPGIQRDGTVFNAPSYINGQWVRFQNGLPRKMGGFRGIFLNASDISRGMTMNSTDGLNYVVSGTSAKLQQWVTDNDDGVGSGPTDYTLTGFTSNVNNLWQFDIGYDSSGAGVNNLIAHPGQNLNDISSTVDTRPLVGPWPNTTLTEVGVFTASATTVTGSKLIRFATTIAAVGAGVTVTGSGIPVSTTVTASQLLSYGPVGTVSISTVGSGYTNGTYTSVALVDEYGISSGSAATVVVSGGIVTSVTITNGGANFVAQETFSIPAASIGGTGSGFLGSITSLASTTAQLWTAFLSNAATASATVTLTFDNNISISGGVVVLHPYLFVYGNYGLIQNCSAGDFNNWTSADSNATNISTGKVIKGLPLRGGTTSPAGLFWTTDSVVRVTYAPSTVNGINYFWKYDLITSQSSIMSSSCVIEYDGIFYWIGTDRFLMYNGVVQEVPNTQNMNWFFDNLNYAQRQKVWVSKVPRWGEIWWFYPRGDATECNDAIIYNVREKVWYDAGQSPGAYRSAGVFSEVFPHPIWAGNEENTVGTYTLWQHETGTNSIYLNFVNAIDSYFETPSLGSYSGLVGSTQQAGDNVWTRCERIEPDFVQSGEMYLIVTGKGYADDIDNPSNPYYFDPDTLKVDMREQRRQLRLRFGSNTFNGNYFMGRVLLSLDTGDIRGTGNP
jgi:hypothetical protein